jgi:predicted extracellular nuclease
MCFEKKEGGLRATFFIAKICPILFLMVQQCTVAAQEATLNIMFYNVENLFDTLDNPLTADEEFTPSSELAYNSERYQEKLTNLSRVVKSAFDNDLPDILGLCEVENRAVVVHLATQVAPKTFGVFHIESPDERGIDNAILYDRSRLSILDSGLIPIDLGEDERPTRGVLWAKFIVANSHFEFYVFVNHWPSRYGGEEESNWKRMMASEALSKHLFELNKTTPNAAFMVMGDFNDHPSNESMLALSNCDKGPCLVNLCAAFEDTEAGSYVYKGEWGVLDQMLVSKNLLANSLEYSTSQDLVGFVKKDWMLYESSSDQKFFPSRTYGGTKYFGGYSDHLPVILVLKHK